jgi:hypothetical protein
LDRTAIVIARSHRTSTDASLSTGYGDEAIQRTKGALRPLDRRVASLLAMTFHPEALALGKRSEGRGFADLLDLARPDAHRALPASQAMFAEIF